MNDLIKIQDLLDISPYLERVKKPIVLVIDGGNILFCGQILDGLFGYRIGIETGNLDGIIRDFHDYESSQGRTPLVFIFSRFSLSAPIRKNTADSNWVVHSTDDGCGQSILRKGMLCSHHHLRAMGIAFRQFGREVLGEPFDYFDLINFASCDGCGPEIVVASKEHGRFCTEDDEYHPGKRFYFRVADLQRQPGYTRFMGGQAIHGNLLLDRVDHCVVSVADLPEKQSWTPRAFTEEANQKFEELISNKPDAGDGK